MRELPAVDLGAGDDILAAALGLLAQRCTSMSHGSPWRTRATRRTVNAAGAAGVGKSRPAEQPSRARTVGARLARGVRCTGAYSKSSGCGRPSTSGARRVASCACSTARAE